MAPQTHLAVCAYARLTVAITYIKLIELVYMKRMRDSTAGQGHVAGQTARVPRHCIIVINTYCVCADYEYNMIIKNCIKFYS